jgi:hypothetical protein
VERQPVHRADNLPPSCVDCHESGSLNPLEPLEPSGPVQACNGIALPFISSHVFDVHGSVHLANVYVRLRVQLDAHGFICIFYSAIFLLYMFRVLFAPKTCRAKI